MGKVIMPNMSTPRTDMRFEWRIAWSMGGLAVMCYAALTEPFESWGGRSPVWAIAVTLLCLQLVISTVFGVFVTQRLDSENSECEV